jgi:hypothetical protein
MSRWAMRLSRSTSLQVSDSISPCRIAVWTARTANQHDLGSGLRERTEDPDDSRQDWFLSPGSLRRCSPALYGSNREKATRNGVPGGCA